MNKEITNIKNIAEKEQIKWLPSLRKALNIYWKKTLKDDHAGMISGWSLNILKDAEIKNKEIKKYAQRLGAASLYFWTAANLQDDLSDHKNTPKIFLPLAESCLVSGHSLSLTAAINKPALREKWKKLWYTLYATNFQELKYPDKIPKSHLNSAGKSLFLLSGPLLLINQLNWTNRHQNNFLQAGKYLLSAKQLADDVYDYKEDWRQGRRTNAHRGLEKLPQGSKLKDYYRQQAIIILRLCHRARISLKKISPLHRQNCLDVFLAPLEIKARLALAKLNQ